MIRKQGDPHETAEGADEGPVGHSQHGSRQEEEEEAGRVGAAECLVEAGVAIEGQPLAAVDSVASSLSSLGDYSQSPSVASLGESSHGFGPRANSFASWVSDTWSAPVRQARRRRYWARKADLKLSGWMFACGLLWEITAESFVEMANHGILLERADDHAVTILGEYVVAVCGMGVIVLIKNRRTFLDKARSVHDRNRRAWRRQQRRQQQQQQQQHVQGSSGDLLSPLVAGAN